MLAVIMAIKDKEERSKAAALYNKYYGTMLGTARRILKDTALAEDAVSEAFIKIIKNMDKIKEISCYETKGYIVIIVRNTALNMLVKQNNSKEILTDETAVIEDKDISILEMVTTNEACDMIIDCIKALPESLSDVLYLSVVLERTYDEISDMLGISRDAAKMRLRRAKKAIRSMLQQEAENNGK